MDEQIWKELFFIVFLIWFLIRVYYGHQSKNTENTEQVRPGLEKGLVGLNFIGMMILPLICIFTPYLDKYQMIIPDEIRFLFMIIALLNVGLFAKIHADLGKNWSPILEIKSDHTLIKTGIYQRIRHPMYAHLWIWVICQGIILNNAIVLIFGIFAWGILYWMRVPKEEDMLMRAFGDEYRDYMQYTGRIFPRIR